MTRTPASSARTVAFAAVLCVLGVAPACGRETFELLPDSSLSSAGRGAVGGSGIASGGAGFGGSAGASGSAGANGAGKAGAGGTGGRFGTVSPCLGEGGCPDDEEASICSRSSPIPFCIRCHSPKDCAHTVDTKICHPEQKRCVQCIDEFQCGDGEACNPLNQRCAKACEGSNDSCETEGPHLSCSPELGICIMCIKNADCAGYGFSTHCYQSFCVECFEDSHCGSQICLGGRCK
jgi:hypothetical protein